MQQHQSAPVFILDTSDINYLYAIKEFYDEFFFLAIRNLGIDHAIFLFKSHIK